MIKVKLNEATKEIELHFKFNSDYINRLRGLMYAQYVPDRKIWTIPLVILDDFEAEFKGEIMYMTPKWQIDGSAPPDYSLIYNQVPNVSATLNAPYSPYPFQSFGANFLAHFAQKYGFACLFDDMGTGKTIQSIYAGLILDQADNLLNYDIPVLVVCKSGLKYQWVTDGINKFTCANSVVIDGTKAKRKKQYAALKNNPGSCEYVVVGYETIREDADLLAQFSIGLTIFDEAHKIRNHETLVNKACRKLQKKYSFFLTGSPISSDPSEIFGLGIIGNPKYFGNWKSFSSQYVNTVKGKYGVDRFYKNLDQLNEKINLIALRRTENEIGLQMPKIQESYTYLERTKIQKDIDSLIDEANEKVMNDLDKAMKMQNSPTKQEVINRLKSSLKGNMYLKVGNADSPELFELSKSAAVKKKYGALSDKKSPKLDYLKEQVGEILSSGNKVVIFTKFETMVRIISRELTKLGINVCTFTGKMSADEKELSRIKFKTDSAYNVFVATNAGAEG